MTDTRMARERGRTGQHVPRRQLGLTIIELLLVLAIFGVLASITAPSIATYIARMRVEGTAEELAATVRYARAFRLQSPQRSQQVFLGISSGTGISCAGVYIANADTVCDCGRTTSSVCTTNALLATQPEMLRIIRLENSTGVTISSIGRTSIMEFDRHSALPLPAGSTMKSVISSNRGGSLQVDIGPTGLPQICEIRARGSQTLHPNYSPCNAEASS
jgi:prepilin-type N-terminal cleavage/methylation domain-containing protein